ncbi:MAG: ABC transporter transmembrane domain-containing protein [Anaerotignum sp.]|nr:ABC transporter transmembrane domain-containing protein [Anaerotignum sp.]
MSAKGFDMFWDYRLPIGERMRKAPRGYFSEQHLGSIQTVLTSTVIELEQYSMMAITDLTGGVLMTLVMMVFFFFYNPIFALVTLCGICVGMWVLHIIQAGAGKHTTKVLAAQENMTTQVLEYVRGISVRRAFSQAEGSEDGVHESFDRKRQADMEQEYASLPLLKIYQTVYKVTGCLLMFTAAAVSGGKHHPDLLLDVHYQCFLVYAEME